MSTFFQSLGRTLAAGFGLLLIIIGIAAATRGTAVKLADHEWWSFLFRWLHVAVGVLWVGLLYYFNFVQTPSMPRIPDAEKPAITKVIAPAAFFWFRHAALWTLILGLTLASMRGYLLQALSFQEGLGAIGTGMWLALIMGFNVWFIIWPNQKKALGIVQAEASEKAAAARTAGLTSRLNVMLSVPMLYCMVAQQNGGL